MTPGAAPGRVSEDAREDRVAQPCSRRGQLVELDLPGERELLPYSRDRQYAARDGGFLDIGPAEVAFEAGNDLPELPIVSRLDAAKAALRLGVEPGPSID